MGYGIYGGGIGVVAYPPSMSRFDLIARHLAVPG